ncbi:MAG: hypothetical protein H7Y86_05995 [Rhizobacter sp.]|nr:hypothetical protein [Ferruginibacter sp.]
MEIWVILNCLFLFSCTTREDNLIEEIEVVDTQLAELFPKNYQIDSLESQTLIKAHNNIITSFKTGNEKLLKKYSLDIIKFKKEYYSSNFSQENGREIEEGTIYASLKELKKVVAPVFSLVKKATYDLPHYYAEYQFTNKKGQRVSDSLRPVIYKLDYRFRKTGNLYIFCYAKISGDFKLVEIIAGEMDTTSMWAYNFNRDSLYFPLTETNYNGNECTLDSFRNVWFTRELKKLQEPSLLKNKNKDIIRLTWLRSFHPAISIRLQHEKKGFCVIKKIQTENFSSPKADSFRISFSEWSEFLKKLERKANYKLMPCTIIEKNQATDEASIILETNINNNYRFIYRSTDNDYINNICLPFLRMANIQVEPGDIY